MKKNKKFFKTKQVVFFLSFFILFLFFNGCGKPSRDTVDLSQLDTYFEKARKEWKIPGMAVAIVKNGKVVLAKGYGVKKFSKEEPVDEKTLFAIASNTKAFTAAALAILVDEEKLNWDDNVRKYLPYFQLYDPYVTEEMTIRDLLCHRCGLGTFSGDLLWYETPYSTAEVVKRAKYLKPAYGFRSGYGYSNIMFIAAGEIFPAVTGKQWKDFVKERIFKPLGMETTNIGTSELKEYDNVAAAHYVYPDGKTVKIPYTTSDNIGPAGGINSNVFEMARWLNMLLNEGTFEKKQILSKERIWEVWSAHNIIRVSRSAKKLFPSTHFRSYGLGWGLSDYHGHKIIGHGGGLDGMISRVALVPEIKLGLVVLTNSINSLPTALMYKIIDTYLGVAPKDWSRIFLDRHLDSVKEQKKRRAEAQKKAAKKTGPAPRLEDYTGLYGGPMYGNARITLEKGKLVLDFLPTPVFISDLSHLYNDTFKIKLRNTFSFIPDGTGTAQFLRNKEGNVVEMKVDIPNRDLFFTELEFKRIGK
jgi:CubicO group peptidase (beta-lactamase class C family)